MSDSRGGGSGTYAYRYAGSGKTQVMVSHLPEDGMNMRIRFIDHGDECRPIVLVTESSAQLLREALNLIAKDLKWDEV
jgi:hypothetical protein